VTIGWWLVGWNHETAAQVLEWDSV
jgi:hypothetical protein